MEASNPSDSQWDCLLNLIKNDPELMTGIITTPSGKAQLPSKWGSIATQVNSVKGATCKKDWRQWKEAWERLRCRARQSYRVKAKSYTEKNMPVPTLKDMPIASHYKKTLAIIGIEALKGPDNSGAAGPANVVNPVDTILMTPKKLNSAKVAHTPPRGGSGLTPASKKRGQVMTGVPIVNTPNNQTDCASTPASKRRLQCDTATESDDAKEVLREHTAAMKELMIVIQSIGL